MHTREENETSKKLTGLKRFSFLLLVEVPSRFELMTPGLPAQCLIHSSTRSLIKKHENLPILTHIRLLQFDTKYLQLDTRYLQLDTKYLQLDTKYLQWKIYFSIQIQKNCKLVVGM